jgi:hypothetical protein
MAEGFFELRLAGGRRWFCAEPEPEKVQKQIVDTIDQEPCQDAGKDSGYDRVQRR